MFKYNRILKLLVTHYYKNRPQLLTESFILYVYTFFFKGGEYVIL